MNPFPCVLLLGAPFVLAADDGDNVLRVHDVSGLSMSWLEDDEMGDTLLPSVGPDFSEPDEHGEPDLEGVDTFVDMILHMYEAEFEYEGRRVELSSNGRLIVRGPEGLHDRVDNLIGFLESVVNAEVRLAVDTVVLPEGSAAPTAAVVDQAVAERWLEAQSGTRGSHVVRLRTDREARLNVGRSEPALIDYDVEIAQGASIQDPIITRVNTGTRLRLRGAPAQDGLFLAYVLERAERLPATTREYGLQFWSGSEQGSLELRSDASRVDDLRVMTHHQAAATFLPQGKALMLAGHVGVQGGSRREVVVLRQVGGALPTRHELPLSREGARLIFADLGAVSPPGVIAEGTLLAPGLDALLSRFNHEPLLRTRLVNGDQDLALDLIGSDQDYSGIDQIGRFLVSRPYGSFMGEDAARVAAEQALVTAAFDTLLEPGRVLDVEVTVRAPGGTPAQARLAVRPGTSAAVVLGVQAVEAWDYDVEVAQFAAVPDLQMRTLLDGLALWLRLSRTRDGGYRIELRGGATLSGPEKRFDLGGLVVDHLHQTASTQVLVDERATMRAADGAWTASFGDSAGLSLTVTAREP